MTQEELDKLKALQGRTKIRGGAPLGAPEGEGLAARSIADYLRGGGGGYGGGGGQQRIPRGGFTQGGPLGGGGLSYGGGGGAQNIDYHTAAKQRAAARDAGASLAELKNADAINRQTNEQNPFGYNKKQTKALENAWASSPDRVALEVENAQRAAQGKPPIQSTFGQNRYHVNPDGSRDYNYSADGQYRGAIPEQFRNAPGDANTHDAHFNRETGQWEAGDLSLGQTFKDIGQGAMDAYGNIRSTIPLMGAEVVDGVKGLAGKFGGGDFISGGGKDGVGNWGALGDFFGGISDKAGLTSYGDLAAKKQAEAPLNSQGRPLSTTDTSGNQYTVNSVFNKPTPAPNAASPGNPAPRRDRENASQKATKAANRAQLSARKASAKLGSGGALHGGGRNDGGYIYRNFGGPIASSNIKEEQIQQQQRAANAPQIASSGPGMGQQIAKKALGSLLGGATGGLGSVLGGLFNDGGLIPQYRNTGGPLANPNGYNEGGAMGETPIKKVMDEQKLMQNQKAFDLDQKRKAEAHSMAMKQKQQAFSQGQKMKQESSTTTMKPKAPLGGK